MSELTIFDIMQKILSDNPAINENFKEFSSRLDSLLALGVPLDTATDVIFSDETFAAEAMKAWEES